MTQPPVPPGPPPPPAAAPPPPLQPPTGVLELTMQGSILTSSPVTPKVVLNGQPIKVSYGLNRIPAYTGPLHIEVSCQWLRTYGQAQLDVQIPEGGAVPVFYAPPMTQFTRGSIGVVKQRRNGLVPFALVMALLVLIVVLVSTH